MAMKRKASTKSKPAKKAKVTNGDAMPFGVPEAAAHLKISAQALRNKLREAEIKKSGKTYGWSSQKAMLADLKKVEAA